MARVPKLRSSMLALVLAAACTNDDGDATSSIGSTADDHTDHGTAEGSSGTSSAGSSAESSGAPTTEGSTAPAESSESGASESSTGAPTMDTWENWAYPEFFTPYCLACHPGESPRDFNDYDVVVENVVHIRCGVAPEMLPDCDEHIEPNHLPMGDGPKPSVDERLRLVAWIDAGMPEQ